MEGINENVKKLFINNRSLFDGKPIAIDGVVDEEAYLKSEIRTMFLLKDANEPDRTEDYVDYLEQVMPEFCKN